MMIKSLELENIRSYKKERIEFPEGVILFEGDIGSGKSTILYAVEFALFGLGDIKSGFILRNGEKEGAVTLAIDLEGKEVMFRRTLERKKTGASQKECSIICNGSRAEYSPEEMKREVLKLLKFNENPSPKATSFIYRYAVFTPQEAMKEILELPEDARLETLRRAFGIEEYRIARNNCGIITKHLKERENFLLGSLKDVDTLALEKKEKSALVQKKRLDISGFLAKENHFEKLLLEYRKKMAELRAKKGVFDKISGELPRLKQTMADKKAAVEELNRSVSEIQPQISSKRAHIKKLEAEKKPTEKSDAEISGELKNVREKINLLSKSIGGLERSVSESKLFDESLKTTERDIALLDKKISFLDRKAKPTNKTEEELSGQIKELRKQSDLLREKFAIMSDSAKKFRKLIDDKICPFCEQKIDPGHFLKKSGAINAELAKLQSSLEEIVLRESEALKTKDGLVDFLRQSDARSIIEKEREMILKTAETAKAKLDEISALRQTLSRNLIVFKKLSEEEARLSKISEDFKKYAMNQMQILDAMREIDMLVKMEENSNGKISALSKEISMLLLECESKEREFELGRAIVSEIDALQKEIETAEDSCNAIIRSVSSANAEIKVLESDLGAVGEKLAKKDAEKKEKESIYETRIWLEEYFSNALASIEQHVLMSINEEFNSLFRKWFGLLMADTEINVSINDAFTPAIVQNGYEQDIRALSGGEKTSVALAYRLALNTIVKRVCSSMNSSGLIILDEPTDGFSKEQLNHLRDVFEELACRQIILVSHERELEAFSDRVFRIVKEGSVSRVLRL
ncbi:DNA double-strand break repair Rad50 ATPase [uncultured archaeon]|nr:DNA double-strand break repair Rad50 ATPase [uncultured archaeon]